MAFEVERELRDRIAALEALLDLWVASCKKAERERDALTTHLQVIADDDCRAPDGDHVSPAHYARAALNPKADTTGDE